MKLRLLQNKLPKLPKLFKSPIHNIYMLGKIINSKLPKSYLSYLNRKNSFQVSSVSTGKIKVSTQTPINKGFGKIGKIFYIFLTLQILFSCQNSTVLELEETPKSEKVNAKASRVALTNTIVDSFGNPLLITLPIRSNNQYYIRYNLQDDTFSINGGAWFTNPYQYSDCDTEFIFAIPKQNCDIEFHSGTHKLSNPTAMQVPSGISVFYQNLTAETILFTNPGCTYFVNTDIVHFTVNFVPY